MMQKRKSYLSLLLASFLLLFTYSFASAQDYEISFENKDVPRCVTADMSVYVTSIDNLGAFEAIFEVGGDFSSFTFTEAALTLSTTTIIDGNVVRVAGYMGDVLADACITAGTTTIGTLHFDTEDLCTGAITVVSATVDDPFTHGSLFVGCDPIVEITPDFDDGLLTIVNQFPEITCPDDQTVHFGETVTFGITFEDLDACETVLFSLVGDSPSAAVIDAFTGDVTWATGGEDVCDNYFTVVATDKCGDADSCEVYVCVQNTPPLFGDEMWAGWKDDADVVINVTGDIPVTDVIYTTLGIELIGGVNAEDQGPYLGPSALNYSMLSFDGPTTFGTGLVVDGPTGEWSWDIAGFDMGYTGDFTLCILVDDGAETCTPCSPENADTLCFDIHVTGFYVDIEDELGDEGKGVLMGSTATVSITMNPLGVGPDPIGGFDFLVAYDASALAALLVTPGSALTDTEGNLEEFEYFTYRFVDNCGGGCPTGLLRIVGLRETNDGILNTNDHVYGGVDADLAYMNFQVSSDLNYECQIVPIRFYWRDCGDNTLSDTTGNFLYLANQVIDPDWGEIIDDGDFGYYGPEEDCYDIVQAGDPEEEEVFKGPLGAVIFENGFVKIICKKEIDDRGDINLNGIMNEVADAVVFTNYFIAGGAAFTINPAGQTAATDINADGTPLSVADLVYLIRIIIGDALPYADNLGKLAPEQITIEVTDNNVNLSGTEVGAALFVFDNEILPTLADNANNMTIRHGYINGNTHVLVYNIGREVLSAGSIFSVEGDANLVRVEASDYFGAQLEVAMKLVPDNFALLQNYPNPFNPETVIGYALPVASNWNISIYNVSGQLVKDFSGYSEAGNYQVIWDATDVASGMYFYKFTTDEFSATKKMVLLK
ncbi:MAG: T9SS type A sorting domain-containing protein [candidate division Zixibacteria bacterium]|nr:T9SS type A sorting domain-containing protein [candidate division Zixibacteria bacterium]